MKGAEKIFICSFTDNGRKTESRLIEKLGGYIWERKASGFSSSDFTEKAFFRNCPIVFIGAAGIAVRMISPFVNSKLKDSPVIVIDENAQFVVPVLSGHAGGANRLSKIMAEALGATPVITTATDCQNKFSVDIFAVSNGLRIVNKDGIKKVSAKVLAGEKITVLIEDNIRVCDENVPEEVVLMDRVSCAGNSSVDVWIGDSFGECTLKLKPKKLCLGIGCKRGKTFEEIKSFVESRLTSEQLENVNSVSTIDLKGREEGMVEFAGYLKVPFYVWSSECLNSAELSEGSFSQSDFVQKITGVPGVCERAAAVTAGKNSKMIINKISENGITLSLVEGNFEIKDWSME